MVRVCHMTSAHDKEDVRIFRKECVSLAKAGYDVTLVERGESYEKNGVHIIGVGYPSGRFDRMTAFAKKVYDAALNTDADIYHIHDPELLPYSLALKKRGKKVIFDSHEHTAESILEKEWMPRFVRKTICSAYTRYQYSACRKLDAIVAVTPNLAEYFKKVNANTYQVANFPIYFDNGLVPQYASKRIVFAGGISQQWNHHNVLKALERLPGCRYCLCGPMGGSMGEGYARSLRKEPGWNQVDYMGRIPHQQVAEELAHCSIGLALLTPGRNTDWQNGSMGNTKIFEEMMAGLPVVCTNFVRWKEFVERYNCGICVDPENVDEIVSAIWYLLENPEEARKMGENGRRAVKEEFNWAKEEKKLFALYDEILKDKG